MLSLKKLLRKIKSYQLLAEEIELPVVSLANAQVVLPNPNIEEIPEADPYHPIIASEQQFIAALQSNAQASSLSTLFPLDEYFEPEPDYEAKGARLLGSGNFGQAVLYRFKFFNKKQLSPDEQRVKKLCDENGLIVMKRGVISEHEQEVTQYLAQYPKEYNQACPAVILNEHGQQEKIILSRYTAFAKDPKKIKPKARYKSYSLKAFLEKMHAAANGIPKWNNKKTGISAIDTYQSMQADFDIMLAQLSSSMMTSIRALHAVGVYHLDISPRNFLMDEVQRDNGQVKKLAVLAADFGEAVQYDPETGLSYGPVRDTGPLRWLDLVTVLRTPGYYSVRTDLYAFRVSLINMLCLSLGLDESAAVFVQQGESAVDNAVNRTKLPSDSAALLIYLNNLKELLNKPEIVAKQKATVAMVQNFIECYGDYIMQPPWDGPAIEEGNIKKADHEALLRANEKFFMLTLQRKLAQLNIRDLAQAKAFKLAITRLFEIEVSVEFKEQYVYATLDDYLRNKNLRAINIDKLRDTVDQIKYQGLKISLKQLNAIFKANLRHYHKAFYIKSNPFRHHFLKTSEEIFSSLAAVPKHMQEHVATLHQYASVLRSQQKTTSQELKSIRLQARRLREYYKKYQHYLQLVMVNFERRFDTMLDGDAAGLADLQRSLNMFRQILLPVETADFYASLLGLPGTMINQRVNSLVKEIEHKITQQETLTKDMHATSTPALIIKTVEEERTPAVKKQKTVVEQAMTTSVAKWQQILNDKKIWTYDDAKHEILVQPKKSRLNFVIDLESNSLVYSRNNHLKQDRKFTAEENKIIDKMVQVFLKTGSSAAELEGNKALCEKAAKLLQAHKQMHLIKINGEVVYDVSNAVAKRTLLNVLRKQS